MRQALPLLISLISVFCLSQATAQSLVKAEQYLREAHLALQRGETRTACEMADLAQEFGRGTVRQEEAASVRRQMCGRMAVEEVQKRQQEARDNAQWEESYRARQQEEERRAATFCRGRPSFHPNVLEELGNRLRTSPQSISLQRLRFEDGLRRCRATMYFPQGSFECSLEFDARGNVQALRGCP